MLNAHMQLEEETTAVQFRTMRLRKCFDIFVATFQLLSKHERGVVWGIMFNPPLTTAVVQQAHRVSGAPSLFPSLYYVCTRTFLLKM